MFEFKSLSLNDKTLFDKYLKPYNYSTCEYSFVTLYLWRNALDIKFTLIDNILIIKKRNFNGLRHFMQPLGFKGSNIKNILDTLINCLRSDVIDILFADVEESFINTLLNITNNNLTIAEDRDNFDYIYETKNLIELSGKYYYNKKNHYKTFINNYLYTLKDLEEPGVINDCIDTLIKWYMNLSNRDAILYHETLGTLDILNNYSDFNIDGMAVYIDNSVAAFTLGEKVNDNMAIIHVEKGDKNIKGIYNFINREFLNRYYSSIKYVNREQDLGLKGLRDTKISYCPCKLEKKYIVDIK